MLVMVMMKLLVSGLDMFGSMFGVLLLVVLERVEVEGEELMSEVIKLCLIIIE